MTSTIAFDVTPGSLIELHQRSSETSINFYQITMLLISEDSAIHNTLICECEQYYVLVLFMP